MAGVSHRFPLQNRESRSGLRRAARLDPQRADSTPALLRDHRSDSRTARTRSAAQPNRPRTPPQSTLLPPAPDPPAALCFGDDSTQHVLRGRTVEPGPLYVGGPEDPAIAEGQTVAPEVQLGEIVDATLDR